MRTRYVGKEWWRRVRLPIIEQRAASEIARYEAKIARIGTSWIPVDMLVEKLWGYSLLYADPVEYGAASGALAALRPDLRMVIVSDREEHRRRLDWNAAHEGAHIVLHVPFVDRDPNQGSFEFGDEVEPKTTERAVYCRDNTCGFIGGPEQPYMYREAEYFAGCLLMARKRYEPLGRTRLTEALEQCMHRSKMDLRDIESNEGLRAIVYTQALESALGALMDDLNRTVSRQAQVIRLSGSELGLIRQLGGIVDGAVGSYTRTGYEFSEHMVRFAARALGLDYSSEWRGKELILK